MLSSTEAEIDNATETMLEVLWIMTVLPSFDINVVVSTVHYDSQLAIAIANT